MSFMSGMSIKAPQLRRSVAPAFTKIIKASKFILPHADNNNAVHDEQVIREVVGLMNMIRACTFDGAVAGNDRSNTNHQDDFPTLCSISSAMLAHVDLKKASQSGDLAETQTAFRKLKALFETFNKSDGLAPADIVFLELMTTFIGDQLDICFLRDAAASEATTDSLDGKKVEEIQKAFKKWEETNSSANPGSSFSLEASKDFADVVNFRGKLKEFFREDEDGYHTLIKSGKGLSRAIEQNKTLGLDFVCRVVGVALGDLIDHETRKLDRNRPTLASPPSLKFVSDDPSNKRKRTAANSVSPLEPVVLDVDDEDASDINISKPAPKKLKLNRSFAQMDRGTGPVMYMTETLKWSYHEDSALRSLVVEYLSDRMSLDEMKNAHLEDEETGEEVQFLKDKTTDEIKERAKNLALIGLDYQLEKARDNGLPSTTIKFVHRVAKAHAQGRDFVVTMNYKKKKDKIFKAVFVYPCGKPAHEAYCKEAFEPKPNSNDTGVTSSDTETS